MFSTGPITPSSGAQHAAPSAQLSPIPIALSLLLLSATGLKAYELFASPLLGGNSWNPRGLRIAAVEVEGFLGLWLFCGLWAGRARWAALATFLVFLLVSLGKALAGEDNCGCFGPVPIGPRWMAALDLAAILALWRWQPGKREGRGVESGGLRFRAFVLLFLLVGLPGGIALAVTGPAVIEGDTEIDSNQAVVVLEPELWVGRRCPLLPYIDIGDNLSRGRWLVVLYHHDCTRCREIVPAYEERALAAMSDPAAPRIAFLAVPPHGTPLWQFVAHSSCFQGRLPATKEWFVRTPAILRLQDGVVQPETAQPWP